MKEMITARLRRAKQKGWFHITIFGGANDSAEVQMQPEETDYQRWAEAEKAGTTINVLVDTEHLTPTNLQEHPLAVPDGEEDDPTGSLTVQELSERLSTYDPNAQVWIGDHANETCCDISHIVEPSESNTCQREIARVIIFPTREDDLSESQGVLLQLLALTASFCSEHRSGALAAAQEAGARALGYDDFAELVNSLREEQVEGDDDEFNQ